MSTDAIRNGAAVRLGAPVAIRTGVAAIPPQIASSNVAASGSGWRFKAQFMMAWAKALKSTTEKVKGSISTGLLEPETQLGPWFQSK